MPGARQAEESAMPLTGKFRFRKTLWGRIVLQLEEEVKQFWSRSKPDALKRRWRDATLMDLAAPELRALIDMRFRPQFRFESNLTQAAPAQREQTKGQVEIGAGAALQAPDVRRTAH
jgi:hypothetical protein